LIFLLLHFYFFIYKDKKIMETKTVKISVELHKELKIYCVQNSLKLNNWIEEVLIEKINEIKCQGN